MVKKIQLSIPTPCHENWDTMTPVQKGKFCGSCQKQVIDFSNMSDRQVAEFFKKPIRNLSKGGSVCGRFMTDQLDREIMIPAKRIPLVKYFFQFMIPAFLVSIKTSAARSQGKLIVKTATTDTTKRPVEAKRNIVGEITQVLPPEQLPFYPVNKPDTAVKPPVCVPNIMGKISIPAKPVHEQNIIKGNVKDENGSPLPGASIMIKGSRERISSDKDGAFSIHAGPGDVLQVIGPGIEPTELVIGRSNDLSIVARRLKITCRVITSGMVIVTRPVKKEIKNVPLIKENKEGSSGNLFRVFPNPVLSGTNLNIEWKQEEEGYFVMQVINQSGQTVHQQDIWIDHEARFLNIDIPLVSAGNYFVTITCKDSGKMYSEKVVIQ